MILDIPERDYHADHTRDSHSALELFLRRRSNYKRWRDGTYRRKVTDELGFGGYFHALVFEGRAAADQRYRVAPSRLDVGQAAADDDDAHMLCNRQRKAGKDEYEKHEAACEREGKVSVLPQDAHRAAVMLEALRAHEEAGRLLFPRGQGLNEQTLHFTGPTGRPSKCRIDRLLLEGRRAPDLKTYKPEADSRRPDVERIMYQSYAFGYHRQGAWYLDALYQETGSSFVMPFVFVSNEDEPKVFVWWMEPDCPAANVGRAENIAALLAIQECEASGDWRQPFESERDQPFRLPPRVEAEAARGVDTSGVDVA